VETLRRRLRVPEWLAQAALDQAVRRRRLRVTEGVAALPSFTPVPRVEEAVVERVVARVRDGGVAPPSWDAVAAAMGAAAAPALREAVRRGLLVAVERDRAWHPEALASFVEAVQAAGASGDLSPAALRDRTGLSRKFLIPLLEWCDRQRITVRAGEGRRLDRPATSRHV
jgi:selenocysteine-specific elongation factor